MMLLVNHLFPDISYTAYQNTELIKCPHQTAQPPQHHQPKCTACVRL